MTRNTLKNAIANAETAIANYGHTEIVEREVCKCVGFREYVPTGKYETVEVFVNDEPTTEMVELVASLRKMYNELYGEADKERARKAKARRLRKELEELNNRKAYIEKWLAENE